MTNEDLKTYTVARPYIRAVIALLFVLRDGPHNMPPGQTFEYYFVMATDFMASFERNRS